MGGQNRVDYPIGTVFKTKACGDVVTLSERVGQTINVQFIDSGYITTCLVANLTKGKVKDWSLSYKDRLGEIISSNGYGDFEILEYRHNEQILVRFVLTGYEVWVTSGNIKAGRVRDPYLPICQGRGFMGSGLYSKKDVKEFSHWYAVLTRTSGELKVSCPTYYDCDLVAEWLNFQNFAGWCQTQEGFALNGWQLDKDLLVPGNRTYGPDTCCFLPRRLNLLISNVSYKGRPYGKTGKFHFRCRDVDGKTVDYLAETMDDGCQWYATFKQSVILEVANLYRNSLSPSAYKALANFKILE